MIGIYIFEGEFNRGEAGRHLIKQGAAAFCMEHGIPAGDFDIEVTPEGKPYFTHAPLHFSLSHSGDMWACAYSFLPCGLDIQMAKDCNEKGIAERFYSPEEQAYAEARGTTGFFRIWVRKEALGKFLGKGFLGKMESVVAADGTLRDYVTTPEGGMALMRDIEISKGIFCALCSTDESDVELRLLAAE